MATYSRTLLSGSTNGRQIPVVAVATPGTLIHTAVAGTAAYDEVYLWAANVTAAPATLTIEWGGVGAPADHLVNTYSLPANSGRTLLCSGEVLQNGLVIRAFSGTANAINIGGFCSRIV